MNASPATEYIALDCMMVFFTVPSMFLGGFIAGRMKKGQVKFLLAGGVFLHVVGIGIFLLTKNMFSVYAMLILYGFSSGMVTPVIPVVLSRYFGRGAFGSIWGTYKVYLTLFGVLAPVYSEWVYDTTGSYAIALTLFMLFSGVAALFMCLVPIPKLREQAAKTALRQTP